MELDFNNNILLLYVVVTILPFLWVWKMGAKGRMFFMLIVLFLFLYSGIGGALTDANNEYFVYYSIYFLVLGLSIRYSTISFNFTENDDKTFVKFINNRGKIIIAMYTLWGLLSLLFPEVIIGRLISPPSPDVYAALDLRYSDNDPGIVANIIDLFQTILLPFYYWALYKYKDRLLGLGGILFFNLYITYCHDSYMGRHVVVMALLVLFMAYMAKLSKKMQRLVVICSCALLPIFAFMLYQYSFLRHGDNIVDISLADATKFLVGEEITYPLHYDSYKDFYDPSLILKYFEWMLFLPLPSFLKFGFGQFPSNKFTEVVTGLTPGDLGFSIQLPGVVGEAVFNFGHVLFIIHAIILGVIIKTVYLSLRKAPSLIFVLYFYALTFSFQLARGGTLSVYPKFFKNFLILSLFLVIIRNKANRRKQSLLINS